LISLFPALLVSCLACFLPCLFFLSQFSNRTSDTMLQDFRPPSGKILLLTHVGGVASAVLLLLSLQWLLANVNREKLATTTMPASQSPTRVSASRLSPAQLDDRSLSATTSGGFHRSDNLPPSITAAPASSPAQPIAPQLARQSWEYFRQNSHAETGLVDGRAGQSRVTMADVAATLAAIVSARELDLIPAAEFDQRLEKLLNSLAQLPLYDGALPHRAYNAKTLTPIDTSIDSPRDQQSSDPAPATGWSALEIGRLARWLKIVASRYPQWQSQIDQIWQSWQVDQLTQSGHLYEVTPQNGASIYQQQGRLGYESYAAYGLRLWGLPVQAALDVRTNVQFVNLYGQAVPIDTRPDQVASPNVSDPYLLDGIETGFQALPKGYADRLLAAQTARYTATQMLTAVAQDGLDRAPFNLTNTFYAQQKPWQSLNQQNDYPDFRFVSTKAAIGWHVLYHNDYTQKLYQLAQGLGSDRGVYSGFYERLNQPNQALTADTNALVLSSLLYQKVQQPLLTWAGVKLPAVSAPFEVTASAVMPSEVISEVTP
jgi:Protein of unknown function (DUF3131)